MKARLMMWCICALFFLGCEYIEPATSNKVTTGDVSEIDFTSAICHGAVNVDITQYENITFGIMISDSKEKLNERVGKKYKAQALIGKNFQVAIGNLTPDTRYYYCAYLYLNNTQYEFGKIKEFGTQVPSLPIVVTSSITQVQNNTALAKGVVKDDGGAYVKERGVVYSTSKEPTISNAKVVSGSGTGTFTCKLSDLQKYSIYYVRAYAINQKGVAYGDEISFTAL